MDFNINQQQQHIAGLQTTLNHIKTCASNIKANWEPAYNLDLQTQYMRQYEKQLFNAAEEINVQAISLGPIVVENIGTVRLSREDEAECLAELDEMGRVIAYNN